MPRPETPTLPDQDRKAPRDFLQTLERMLAALPDGHPLRDELIGLKSGIFLILPETAHEYWAKAAAILDRHIMTDTDAAEPWAQQVEAIWFGREPVAEKRCGNCAHWGTVPYEYYDPELFEDVHEPTFRICGAIVRLGTIPAQRDDDHALRPETRETVQAFTRDASGCMAELWTRGDHHCALWAPKDEPR